MSWYQTFNLLEGVLWWIVAVVIIAKVPRATQGQYWGVVLAVTSFFAFGITDIIEANYERAVPLWLWGFKVICGIGIFVSRYTWLSWSKFRWTDREFLFGLACLAAVVVLILVQVQLDSISVGG